MGIRWSRHSRRTVLTQRSAIEFARGARIGVRRLLMARAEARWPKSAPQTRSRSWIRYRGLRSQGVDSISCRQTQTAVGWAVLNLAPQGQDFGLQLGLIGVSGHQCIQQDAQ
jgi:hypothetical protein